MADFWDTYIDSLDASPKVKATAKAAVSGTLDTLKSAVGREVPVAAQGVVDLAQRPFQRAGILREMGVDPLEYSKQQIHDPAVEAEVEKRLRALSDTQPLAESIDDAKGFTPRESQTPGQRVASDAIVGGTLGLATAPLGGGAALATISGATGGASSGLAREAGLSERGQLAAGMLGGASPALLARGPVTGPLIRGAMDRAAPGFARGLAEDEAAFVLRDILGKSDPSAALAAERAHPVGRATLAQVTGNPRVQAVEGQLLNRSPAYAEQLFAQQQGNAAALRQAEAALLPMDPGVAGDVAAGGLQDARETAKAGVDRDYGEARRLAEITGATAPTDAVLKATSAVSQESRDFLANRLPPQIGEILDKFESGTASLNQLDNLSKSLGQTLKDLHRAGDDQGMRLAAQVKSAVDRTFTDLQSSSPAAVAFKKAKATQSAYADLFSLKHPSVKGLLERAEFGTGTQPRESPRLLGALRKKPSEAFRLRRALKGDPDGTEGAQRLVMNEVLKGRPLISAGPGMPGANLSAAISEMESPSTRVALTALMDRKGYEGSLTLMRRARQLTATGNQASPQQAYRVIEERASKDGTALGVILADAAVGLKAPVVRGAVGATAKIVGWPRRFYDGTTAVQRQALVERALLGDLDTLDLLLAKPNPRQIREWNQKLETAKAALDQGRAGVRSALQGAPPEENP